MFHIAYVSSAVTEFTKPQLRELLTRSQENNGRMEITGLLLYGGGNFMQVVEGPEASVRALYDIVCKDPRHKDIYTLLEEPLAQREFPDWSMAFHDLEMMKSSHRTGYSDFLRISRTGRDGSADASKARRLLARFKEQLR